MGERLEKIQVDIDESAARERELGSRVSDLTEKLTGVEKGLADLQGPLEQSRRSRDYWTNELNKVSDASGKAEQKPCPRYQGTAPVGTREGDRDAAAHRS